MDVRTTERQRIVMGVMFRCTLTCACTWRISSSTILAQPLKPVMKPRQHVLDALETIRLALDSAADCLPRDGGARFLHQAVSHFLFAVSTRRHPASCRAATSKRRKIERCRVFVTPVSCGVRQRSSLKNHRPCRSAGPGARGILPVSGPKPRRREPTVTLDLELTIAKY
jgi:hypothetical protein